MNFDVVLSICFAALSYAMIPQVIYSIINQEVKISSQTLWINSIALTIITFNFCMMEFLFSSIANTITMMSWWTLLFLKFRYKTHD